VRERLLPAVVLALGVAAGGWFVANAIRYAKAFERIVEVRGLDERIVKSDKASWQMGFSGGAASAQGASEEVARETKVARAFLVESGFAESEIRSTPVSLNDNWVMGSNRSAYRFTARGGLVVETDKVDGILKAVESTRELLKRGVVVENSFARYYFTDLNRVKPEMLAAATANARQAAETFAKDSKTRLGGIRSASQGLFTIGAPLAEYEGETSVMKKVRVVTRVQYFLEK
jgi:hypothetical protein